MTEAVVYKFKIEQEYSRLDVFVKEYLDTMGDNVSRAHIIRLIKQGLILVNGKKLKPSKNLKTNDEIYIKLIRENTEPTNIVAENIPLRIVYEDDHILVINKKADMVVHPGPGHFNGTLANAVLYYTQGKLSETDDTSRPGIVHRLDKDTSGLIVVAKNNYAHVELAKQFMDKTARRTYIAVVKGVPKEKCAKIETLYARNTRDRKKWTSRTKEGKLAITNYCVLKKHSHHSLLMLKLGTGRTHQIRVHLTEQSFPIIGDQTYGNAKHECINRQALHALSLSLIHPVYKLRQSFSVPIEQDIRVLIKDLNL